MLALRAAAGAYHESPMLAERVARGELPPVEERLPAEPEVVEPVESIGRHGGAWRRVAMGGRDIMLATRMGYDPLVRWDRTGTRVAPGLAKSWEVLDEGRTFVFHLRRGLRWSDGHPLTAEDFLFVYEDDLLEPELSPIFPQWLQIGDTPVQMLAPDPLTLVFRFAEPYGIFPGAVAFRGNGMLAPKHYLKLFHKRYVDEAELARKARALGMDHWTSLYRRMASHEENPELPTWRAFQLVTPPPATRVVAERNPYYWKVDPAGNQLPYVDRVTFMDVQNNEIANMKAMAGDLDFQARRIDTTYFALFMQNRERAGYRVLRDTHPSTICIYINQHSKDPDLRPILQDRRFRIALSIAINREELIDLMFTGLAEPSRGIACPEDPFYLPEFDAKYLEYDPDRANALLDEVGLTRGEDGMRRMPDGKRFRRIINVYPSETGTSMELWQLVADYYREVGLDFVVKTDARNLSVMQVVNGNSDFWAYSTGGIHWVQDPIWYVPWHATSYYAPAYGRYVATGGKDKLGIRPPPEFQRLVDWYSEMRSTTDEDRRLELGHKILGQWAEESYIIGICRPTALTIVSNRFRNVPDRIIHDWRVMTPGYIGIEQFYFDAP